MSCMASKATMKTPRRLVFSVATLFLLPCWWDLTGMSTAHWDRSSFVQNRGRPVTENAKMEMEIIDVSRSDTEAILPSNKTLKKDEASPDKYAPSQHLNVRQHQHDLPQSVECTSAVEKDNYFDNDNKPTTTGATKPYLSPCDYIYKRRASWEGPPIISEDFKLVFFPVPKVGSTVMKKLFRRIAGYSDWTKNQGTGVPHNPSVNGLKYLSHYNITYATYMMTSDEWTRAVFVREPKERLLSAYLDKAKRKNGTYVSRHCCPDCGPKASTSFKGFLQVMKDCVDPHWMPQSFIMEKRFWTNVQFVGHIETAEADAKALLKRVGAWEAYGATGWGTSRNESIFQSLSSIRHETKADQQLMQYYDHETELLADEYYEADYANEKLGFQRKILIG